MDLRLDLLGEISITRNAKEHLPPRKPAAILALVSLGGERRWSRDELCGIFWPGMDLECARANLRTALSGLRSSEFTSGIVGSDRTYVWREVPVESDVAEFEGLVRKSERLPDLEAEESLRLAAELYRGEFLPGLHAEWVMARRADLRRLISGVLLRLGTIAEAKGDLAEALRLYEQAEQQDPTEEGAIAAQMRLSASAGRIKDAADAYARYRKRLEREVGLTPSDALKTLMTRIQKGIAAPPPLGTAQTAAFSSVVRWLLHRNPATALSALAASTEYWRAAGGFGDIATIALAAIEQTPGESIEKAAALRLVGLAHVNGADYAAAEPRFLEALAMQQRLGDRRGLCLTLVDLVHCRRESKGDAECLELAQRALRVAEDLPDEALLLRAQALYAGLTWALDRPEEAKVSYERLVERLRKGLDQENLATTLANLGILSAQLGEAEMAEDCLSEAQQHAVALGSVRIEWGCYLGLGGVGLARGDLAGAVRQYASAATAGFRMGNLRFTVLGLEGVATGDAGLGRWQQAAELFFASASLRSSHGLLYAKHEQRILGQLRKNIEAHLNQQEVRRIVARVERISLAEALALLPA